MQIYSKIQYFDHNLLVYNRFYERGVKKGVFQNIKFLPNLLAFNSHIWGTKYILPTQI